MRRKNSSASPPTVLRSPLSVAPVRRHEPAAHDAARVCMDVHERNRVPQPRRRHRRHHAGGCAAIDADLGINRRCRIRKHGYWEEKKREKRHGVPIMCFTLLQWQAAFGSPLIDPQAEKKLMRASITRGGK